MTEAEWLAGKDPLTMLDFLRGRASGRKLRLFGCACFRLRPATLIEKRDREMIKLAEFFADGLIGGQKLTRFACSSWAYTSEQPHFRSINWLLQADVVAERSVRVFGSDATENDALAKTLRALFGNPFGESQLDRCWLTAPVQTLARQSYQFQDFVALPILSDALEDAGCADDAILSHLRSPGPHVRGCWALDLILGKE